MHGILIYIGKDDTMSITFMSVNQFAKTSDFEGNFY